MRLLYHGTPKYSLVRSTTFLSRHPDMRVSGKYSKITVKIIRLWMIDISPIRTPPCRASMELRRYGGGGF